MNWEKVYFQKDGDRLMETIRDFRLYCCDVPFSIGGEAKELPNNEWGDEDGVEEYVPKEGIPLKDYDIDLTFLCKGSQERCRRSIESFRDYLTGRDGKGATYAVYSEHSCVGKKDVRFMKMDENPEYAKTTRGMMAKVKVTLKVRNPRNNVTLNLRKDRLDG